MLKKLEKKPFSPYVEVSLNDHTFSIRKTTAIWLLQENERVSSDRLFRVREKQPFASTSQSLMQISCANPVMLATLTVGDLCLFKLTTDWQLGRILQFAKYDTDTKKYSKPYKEQNAKASSKHVGVLCTWYELVKDSMFQLTKNREMKYIPLENYICTLPEGCIIINNTSKDNSDGDLPQAKQSSLTAKNFSIREQCMESLLTIVENYEVTKKIKSDQKYREKSESSAANTLAATSPIFISNDSNLSTIKDHWTKCCGISLSKRDLQKLTGGKELSDLHINAFQNLLKSQFNSIGGLQSTLLQQNKSPLSNKKENNLQAINISISATVKRWAVLEINSNGIFLYDSAYTSLAGDVKKIIAHLINTNEDQLTVHIMNIAKQSGATDCGLYAVAIMSSLALGKDPCSIVFKKEDLRAHLQSIIEKEQITEFPYTQRRKVRSRILHTEVFDVYCICRMPDNGSKMVCCDNCNKWFHAACVEYTDNRNKWYCTECSDTKA